jgi:hypothetical protein
MSDSRFFPQTTEGATRALRSDVPETREDDGMAAARLDALDDDRTNGEPVALLSLVSPDPTPESDQVIVEELAPPFGDTLAAIDREDFNDLQPMLDLRFPETEQPTAQVVPDTDIANGDEDRIELIEADQLGVTGIPDSGLKHAVLASFVEMPSEELATPIDAPSEEPSIHRALDPTDLEVEAVGDPAYDTEALTSSADTNPEVAGASAFARDEAAFAAPEEVYGSLPLVAVTSDSGLPQAVPVEDDPTTSRIAVEANATAQALENLKRLLAHKLPDLTVEAASRLPDVSPVQPPPIQIVASTPFDAADFAHQDDGIEEFPIPPMRGERHGRGAGFAVGSFLSGFAASWIFGAALYAYLIFG